MKVVKIVPPTVETHLHRERADPDENKKGKNPGALTVEEVMGLVRSGFEGDRDLIAAGMSVGVVVKWEGAFEGQYVEG